jgi:hypothetical protein
MIEGCSAAAGGVIVIESLPLVLPLPVSVPSYVVGWGPGL